MRLPLILISGLFSALSACGEFPELESTIDKEAQNARYPDLVPIESIKSDIPDTQIEPEAEEDLEDRVDQLKARAKRLKGAVVDKRTRERMKAGIEPVSE